MKKAFGALCVGLLIVGIGLSCAAYAPIYEGAKLREFAQLIANDINNPEITTRFNSSAEANFVGHTLIIEGSADRTERDRAASIASAYLKERYMPLLSKQLALLNLIEVKTAK
ncbi:MAG: hypothetical protein EOP06_23135 [Proteobacteria bacterium]|nr:MAG: hypothetical protein EOP06_23135 [Pseudomonadota bacterium]